MCHCKAICRYSKLACRSLCGHLQSLSSLMHQVHNVLHACYMPVGLLSISLLLCKFAVSACICRPAPEPDFHPRADKSLHHLQTLEKELSSRPQQDYLITSSFTAADIMVGYVLGFVREAEAEYVDLKTYPHVLAYTERVLSRPAAKLVLSKYNKVPNGRHSCQTSSLASS